VWKRFLNSKNLAYKTIIRSRDIKFGITVIKIRRNTGYTEGVVNRVVIQIRELGVLTQEGTVVTSNGELAPRVLLLL